MFRRWSPPRFDWMNLSDKLPQLFPTNYTIEKAAQMISSWGCRAPVSVTADKCSWCRDASTLLLNQGRGPARSKALASPVRNKHAVSESKASLASHSDVAALERLKGASP
jgi:hypothetical protein